MVITLCLECVHRAVCRYRDGYERYSVIRVPAQLQDVVEVKMTCKKFLDQRYFKVVRPMGCEV